MGKKYYAVKIGKKIGIYSNWGDCKEQVEGVSGAVYKSFKNLQDAEFFLSSGASDESNTKEVLLSISEWNKEIDKAIENLENDECIAFVDGSYNEDQKKSGYGAIVFDSSKEKNMLYKAFHSDYKPDFVKLRNVSAELEAVKDSILLAIEKEMKKITIYFDYIGISEWANGNWKAKKQITKEYVKFINEKKSYIDIGFIKVPAHEGVTYNEEADKLAKRSLLSKGHRTYQDGSVYFVKYDLSDWKEIINLIDEENNNFGKNTKEIKYEVTPIKNRTKIKVDSNNQTVYINCYSVGSYVQGKHTTLYQKLVSTAVECLTSDEEVVEVLDNYYAIDIPKDEVIIKFDRLVPNYKGQRDDKIFNNILTSVYNTMISAYMPDYTQLLTPIFRTYEFCLHRMLGDKLGLTTQQDRGRNNFSYFNKNQVGRYYLNNPSKSLLNKDQLALLEEIYNQYNSVRHKYSHWSFDEVDTAVVETIEEAREIIEKGLTNIDKYYMMYY